MLMKVDSYYINLSTCPHFWIRGDDKGNVNIGKYNDFHITIKGVQEWEVHAAIAAMMKTSASLWDLEEVIKARRGGTPA